MIFFMLLCSSSWAQRVRVGKFIDATNHEPISGTIIKLENSKKVFVADKEGLCKISKVLNSNNLNISSFGYRDTIISLSVLPDTFVIAMMPKINELGAVMVSSAGKEQEHQTGLVTLRMKEVKEIATLFGSADPLKLLQLKPGMTLTNEGDGGIYVRGGDNGQNLVLLENIPLHKPTHLLGFYSVFNEPATREMALYKSAPPARFGSKLSSVIDVSMTNSADSLIEGEVSAGIISSSATIKGTTRSKRVFYLFSGRQAYLGLIKNLMKPIPASTSMLNNTDYRFSDYYSLLKFQTSSKSALTLSSYLGNDNYFFTNPAYMVESKMKWGNAGISAKWNLLLDNGLDILVSTAYSQYQFSLRGISEQASFELNNLLYQWNLRGEFSKKIEGNFINAGVEFSTYELKPNRFTLQTGSDELIDKQTYRSQLYAPFLQVNWANWGKWSINTGVRTPLFLEVGPIQKYDANGEKSTYYSTGDIVFSQLTFEPRVNVTYQLTENTSLKSSWSRLSQPIHQIPVGSVSMPTDFWLSSAQSRKPAMSNQYTLGWFANYPLMGWEFSAESYYRKMQRLVELNTVYFNNPAASNLDANLYTGSGYSYGIEFYIKKKTERYLAWISYVYSRTYRHFADLQSTDYPAKYDRPHDLKFVQRYILSPKWTVSAVWVYASGNNVSLPVSCHIIQGNINYDFEGVNNFRFPAYHRLDVSATRNVQWYKYKGELNLSVFNVYNRANPYFYYYRVSGNLDNYYLKIRLKRVSMFPILPSISLKFYF